MVDAGREGFGVPEGVPFGVDCALPTPTRDFLDEDLGVMLLLIKALTGVTSSCEEVCALEVVPTLLRGVRLELLVPAEATEGASRGATGVFAVRVVASVGFSGRGVLVLVRSVGIVRIVWCSS